MPASASTLPGLLLLQSDARRVAGWVARGTVPAYVAPVGGWTAVVPAGESAAQSPYDDGLTVLSNRPVPSSMRSAIGFFVIERKAVVVAHPPGLRAEPRWLVWEPGKGASTLPPLPPARPLDLLVAADVDDTQHRRVTSLLRAGEGDAAGWLQDLMAALALPAAHLLAGSGVPTTEDAVLVTPSERDVRRFERSIGEDRLIRDEQEEMQ